MAFAKEVKYASVTLDFLLTLPDLDFSREESLQTALYAVGFDLFDTDEEGNTTKSRIDRMDGVNVRCADRPYMCRKTTVFSGRLREDFKYGAMYDGVDILDIGKISGSNQLVSDMDYDIPNVTKANTRKYTKRQDKNGIVDVDLATKANLEALYEIFGEGDK